MKTKLMAASALLAISVMANSSFAALVMHLDADTLGLADGTPVATWTDLAVGAANDAVQTNETRRPVYVANNAAFNNHATVSFEGSHYMDLNGSMITVDSFTLFIVGNFDSVATINQYMISAQGGAGNDRLRVATYSWSGDAAMTRIGTTGDKNLGAIGTNMHVIAVTGTANAWLDLGAKQAVGNNTAGALNPSDFVLGCYDEATSAVGPRDFLGGDIAEVRLYNEILTDGEIEAINAEWIATYRTPNAIELTSSYPESDGVVYTEGFPVEIGGVLVDGASAVDSASIELLLDSTPVVLLPGDVVKTASTTTVSHAVSSLDVGVHTVSLVYAGISPAAGPFTNTWVFAVKETPVSRNVVYVDADTTNTLAWDGSDFSAWVADGSNMNWTPRTVFGNNGQVYQSQYAVDSPRLKTTVSGLADGTYNVYAYMWVAGTGAWRIEAALTNYALADLPLYIMTDYPSNTVMSVPYVDNGTGFWGDWSTPVPSPYYSTNLLANPFGTSSVNVAEGNRRLVEVYLGTVSGAEITVYVDDDSTGSTEAVRTWYDGIGYERVGLATNPDIQSITVAGGMVTLLWTSESAGTYSILRKTNLTDSAWISLKTGIAGGDPTTSDSVSVSGAGQEFFRIEGE